MGMVFCKVHDASDRACAGGVLGRLSQCSEGNEYTYYANAARDEGSPSEVVCLLAVEACGAARPPNTWLC
jgi:hypothetical protein